MSTRYVRRIDDLGRIVLPKDIRRVFFGGTDTVGVPMEIYIENDSIVLKTHKEESEESLKLKAAIQDLEVLKRGHMGDVDAQMKGLTYEQYVQTIIDNLKEI